MKTIKKTILIITGMTYGITNTHPFSCTGIIQRFGPNSYLTRIPLYFKVEKNNSRQRAKKRSYKKIENEAQQLTTCDKTLHVSNIFETSKDN